MKDRLIIVGALPCLLLALVALAWHQTAAAENASSPATANSFALLGGGAPAQIRLGSTLKRSLSISAGTGNVLTGAQSYLTFTNSILQVADYLQTGCVVTNTLTPEVVYFDALLQNEVCNSSSPCDLGRLVAPPGSISFSSGWLSSPNCTSGCTSIFPVAYIGLCATNPGNAVVHWQFSPPAPANRDSEIVDNSNTLVQNPALYTDYNMQVVTGTLVGHVTWQGRPAQPNSLQQLPITASLRLQTGGPDIEYASQNTDASGFFTISLGTLPDGTYSLRVKGPKYQAKTVSVTLSTNTNYNVEIGLQFGGDCNNDNTVNVQDFNILRAAFGTTLGDPGYDDRADFTGNTVIDIRDFDILRARYGTSGSGPIRPGP